jgi:hypothetical protein
MSTFHDTLALVGDSRRRLSRRDMKGRSDIGRELEGELHAAWLEIDGRRRREIIRTMVELAEDNVDLDFRDVFCACLADTDPQIRHAAVDGLWDDDRARTMRQLLTLLASDPDDDVRATAALGLGRFAYRASLEELRPVDVEMLRAALVGTARNADLGPDVRRRALEGAGYFAGPDVDEAIAQAYASGNVDLKASALAAIGHSLDRRWLPIVEAELASSEPALRYEAARASGELGEEAASLLPKLLPLAEDSDVEIYTAAIWALGQIGGSAARRTLRRLVNSDEAERQAAAEDALSELEFNVDPSRLV